MGQDHIEFVFDDAKATIISRGEERDQPDGERTIPRCVTAFNAITGHNLSNCDGWLFMEVLKKCRSVQGRYKYDDYRDGVGYAALRAEEARMENEKPNEALTAAAEKFQKAIDSGELVVDGPCLTDAEVARGHHVLTIALCEHERSNCYECKLFNKIDVRNHGTTGPPASDHRHDERRERDRARDRARAASAPSEFAEEAARRNSRLDAYETSDFAKGVARSKLVASCDCLDPDCPAKVGSEEAAYLGNSEVLPPGWDRGNPGDPDYDTRGGA